MMTYVKARSLTSIVGVIWELSIELYAFKLAIGFQQRLAHVSSSWFD
jgi:hypothetical protein